MKYRSKYGGFNQMMRTEWAAATIASTIANVNRMKDSPVFKVYHFAPHIEEPSLTLEEAKKKWS
ncbi:hypothetical protein LLQ54_20140 [Rouxiella badensis]|nr:hypothetical protein [Rouxiella badensis]MCC3720523.1 hypothetical protein [Rouxiella badensis]MCC3730362.1 hypothetical protein [Rouxiella badensis]MCC3742187.1 hypothetical protein [Rouxiella badensis]WAT06492.1 hypothetical protein O1V64_11130 [Rouxiella badensis]